MARRSTRRSGSIKRWSAVSGESNINPGAGETIDLVPPEFRPEGDEEMQEITLLRIRGYTAIMAGEDLTSAITNDVPDSLRWQVLARMGIWGQPTIEPDPGETQSLADQGLLWTDVMATGMQVGKYELGAVLPDQQGLVASLVPSAVVHFDVKSMRHFKRFHQISQFTQDLVYRFERESDEGSGVSELTVRHFFLARCLWLVRG